MGADTLHRPPLFQHQLSARSAAALDLVRAFSASFGFTVEHARWPGGTDAGNGQIEFPITREGICDSDQFAQ